MFELGVHSEVGKLRKVMVHRPDLSLRKLTPDNHDDLLSDDVLLVDKAQKGHEAALLGSYNLATKDSRNGIIEPIKKSI